MATRTIRLSIIVENQNRTNLVSGESTVRILEKIKPATRQRGGKMDKLVVLVTGGSRDIGGATARMLATQGHSGIVSYLKSEREARALVEEIANADGKAIAVAGDVADHEDVKRIFETGRQHFGNVSAVVHCASPNPIPEPFGAFTWLTQEAHWQTQVHGAFSCVQCAIPDMLTAQSGAFVFLGSISTDGVPPVQQTPYIVAKSALTALARTLASEYGPKGLRTNTVSPGMTYTEMIANIPEKTKMLAKTHPPLRRLGHPEEVAETIAFRLGSGARHITGQNLRVCGGAVMV